MVPTAPVTLRHEHGLILADADCVMAASPATPVRQHGSLSVSCW
jgi:hypothetical protein